MQPHANLSHLISKVTKVVLEIEAIQEARTQGTGKSKRPVNTQPSWA